MDINENPYAELETKYANNISQQNQMLDEQSKIQNEQINANTQEAMNRIEQQKGYAQKDYQKEQRGAYQDYQKAINPYGVQAENLYSNGLGNSGYSETSKLNAFNTYQNRYSSAKESTDRMMDEFNNQMNQAKLEGNKELAQVALNKLQTQMDNLWKQLSFDSSLTESKTSYNQWLNQFNYQKEQDAIQNAFAREQFEYQKEQNALARAYSGGSSSGGSSGSTKTIRDTTSSEKQMTKEELEALEEKARLNRWASSLKMFSGGGGAGGGAGGGGGR